MYTERGRQLHIPRYISFYVLLSVFNSCLLFYLLCLVYLVFISHREDACLEIGLSLWYDKNEISVSTGHNNLTTRNPIDLKKIDVFVPGITPIINIIL